MAAKLDSFENLRMEDQYGVIVRLERLCKVTGLAVYTDYTALVEALSEVGLDAWTSPDGMPWLRLTNRSVSMTDKDAADVICVYTHFIQDIQYADGGSATLYGECASSLQQVPTNRDGAGDMIILQHTYPTDDQDFAGETKQQTGEITVFDVQKTRSYKFFYTTDDPDYMAYLALGAINDDEWNDGEAKTWMCTAFNYTPHVIGGSGEGSQYIFNVEFQYNPNTWDTTAVFIDERWGRPPSDLVEGVGYKTIERQLTADFDAIVDGVLFR